MIDNIAYNQNFKYTPQNVVIPKIPKTFLENDLIRQVLYHTIAEFNFEEQMAIFLYCFVKMPMDEISDLEGMPLNYVASVLVLYAQRLNFKVETFKKAVFYDVNCQIDIKEMFEIEMKLANSQYFVKNAERRES